MSSLSTSLAWDTVNDVATCPLGVAVQTNLIGGAASHISYTSPYSTNPVGGDNSADSLVYQTPSTSYDNNHTVWLFLSAHPYTSYADGRVAPLN